MVDRYFADPDLARFYDALCAGRDDFHFYLPLVMAARSVLDVACGTGDLLHRARRAGHTGRLCGLDPGEGMMRRARRRTDIEWVLGDLSRTDWYREFDLVVMTGHAFQVFLTDEELGSSLRAIRSALTDDGRFVFETRNPLVREWERWTPDVVVEATDDAGALVRARHEVEEPVVGDLVSFSTTFTSPGWDGPRTSRSTLRFLGPDALSSFLGDAGLEVEEQFGDWSRGPLTPVSPEIITVAGRRTGHGARGRFT